MALPKRKTDETRSKKRVTKVLPVECKVIDFAGRPLTPHVLRRGDVFGGRTINLSHTGLQVHSDYELDKGTQVEIVLSLGDSKPKIKMDAEVAWAKRNAADLYGRWAMGMRFIDIDEGDLESLEQFFRDEEA